MYNMQDFCSKISTVPVRAPKHLGIFLFSVNLLADLQAFFCGRNSLANKTSLLFWRAQCMVVWQQRQQPWENQTKFYY